MLISSMKAMVKTKKIPVPRAFVMVVTSFVLALTPVQQIFADTFDTQINALKQQVADYQDQAAQLHHQADTYQNKVNELAAQKSQLQAQIDLNNVKIAQLDQQIIDTQAKMEQEKTLLGNSLVTLYLDNSVSPLEVLAS